jgi:hypothetical protein
MRRTRLKRLESAARNQGLVLDGCPVCRKWRGRIVHVDAYALSDGTVVPGAGDGLLLACAACGQVPEFVIETVRPAAKPLAATPGPA